MDWDEFGSVIQTLRELIRIDSVNPAYEGGVSESGVAGYIRRFFEVRGIETSEQEVFPGRPNILARVPGREPSQRVVFEAHMDTAGITGMDIPPFEPRVADGKVYGRGACDTKAGLAAMMHAVARVAAGPAKARCEIVLAATADEDAVFAGCSSCAKGCRRKRQWLPNRLHCGS